MGTPILATNHGDGGPATTSSMTTPESLRPPASPHPRNSSFGQHSIFARNVLMSQIIVSDADPAHAKPSSRTSPTPSPSTHSSAPASAPGSHPSSADRTPLQNGHLKLPPAARAVADTYGAALTDTPLSSMPGSPHMPPMSRNISATSTPRSRPTTLDIPGLTKSKVSPDGKIAQRDVGSKLVIVMVGLPARGKSYITKKMMRYLNWLQHDTKIFNVGERRRVAASGHGYRLSSSSMDKVPSGIKRTSETRGQSLPEIAAHMLMTGDSSAVGNVTPLNLPPPEKQDEKKHVPMHSESPARVEVNSPGPELHTPANGEQGTENEAIDQSASFFDPLNRKAAQLREQCAMETLDELLDYILYQNGSVGIFDATNSTLARRKQIMKRIRDRAGPELNVLFVESVCHNKNLLEANMRLKLSGPDYEGTDPVAALEDFKNRVAIYEKNYVPLGDYEEENNMPYVKMIDVGRKMISHQIRGFLAGQAVFYLLNFNLSPRMIWITRHGESEDNIAGKIGGDSDLSPKGRKYAKTLTRFIEEQRREWTIKQADKMAHSRLPPTSGDDTPPNPYYGEDGEQKNFCVWTSMLKRSIQTAENFDEEEYDVKQMRMLDELNAGIMEGLTYEAIKAKYADEYECRKSDKLAYRYPGPGGEGYLDIINRIRPVIVELERMTDHCLLITHRSVARVLLAYFQGLKREDVADLDCPLGMLYQLEPKPYGVEFKAWRYNEEKDWFDYMPDYKLHRGPAYI